MRRTLPAASFDRAGPFDGINITPLIDVLLVLLVMFILTIPAVMHEVPIDLPAPSGDPALPTVPHRLEIAAGGAMRLDGTPVALATLPARLSSIAADSQSLLTMRTDPEAQYDAFLQATAAVKRAGITRLGFEGLRES